MSQANQFRHYPNRASLAIISLHSLSPSLSSPHKSPTEPRNLFAPITAATLHSNENKMKRKKKKKLYLFRAYRLPFKDPPELAPMPRMHTFQSFQDGRFFLVMVDAAALAVRAGVGEDSELAGVAIGAWTC